MVLGRLFSACYATYDKCMSATPPLRDVCSQLELQFAAASLVCATVAAVMATCMGLWLMDALIYMQYSAWRAGRVRHYAKHKVLASGSATTAGGGGDWHQQVDQEAERMLKYPRWSDIWWR